MSQRTVPDDALLDAGRACVLAAGVRRTTMTDVARAADVSRMTLYRRFPDVTSLIQALMTREFTALLARVEAEVATLPSARERLVEAAVLGVERLARDPLFARIVELDPELLLPYLTRRLGGFQHAVVAAFERLLAAGAADGSIAAPEPALVAAALERVLRGFALQPRADLAPQLRRLLDGYLAPAP